MLRSTLSGTLSDAIEIGVEILKLSAPTSNSARRQYDTIPPGSNTELGAYLACGKEYVCSSEITYRRLTAKALRVRREPW